MRRRAGRLALLSLALAAAGCTTLEQWVHNGFKVGPNFQPPPAAVAPDWIDHDSGLVRSADNPAWWLVFGDPALGSLVDTAHQQNLDLQTAATRVLEAAAQRNIAAGNLLPQTQSAVAAYLHGQTGNNGLFNTGPISAFPSILNLWVTGFNISWELDFWGRIRRNIESKTAELDSSVESYRAALVTLQADVAVNYVQLRTYQQRLTYARRNVEIQRGSLQIAEARLREGRGTGLDVEQARSGLARTEATIPTLQIGLRQAANQICILLGQSTRNLAAELPEHPIPTAPPQLAVGIPADLLQRRPDVRRARKDAAAQCSASSATPPTTSAISLPRRASPASSCQACSGRS
jgi:NodT family efflux transporter outer membrane factor (OMF) lipoprotein